MSRPLPFSELRRSKAEIEPKTSVVVVGEAMIELSDMKGQSVRMGVAGDTFNTAVYLSRSGIDVSYISAVGDDAYSQKILNALEAEGINSDGVPQLENHAPGLYAVDLDAHGERSFTYWRSDSAARSMLNSHRVVAALKKAAHADLLYLSGITLSLFGPLGLERIFETMQAVRDHGGEVAFDPNYRAKGWGNEDTARSVIQRAVRLSTITLPTFDDEAALFGDEAPSDCLARHLEAGVHEVVVKHGEHGALTTSAEWIHPERVIKPLDTTGAGDSFNAAYLAARLKGGSVEWAVLKGHELAANVLACPGAIIEHSGQD